MVSQFKWCVAFGKGNKYAQAWANGKRILLHKYLTSFNMTDHKDGNGLNNQRSNLREATREQNQMNQRPRVNTTSKYKGVFWNKLTGKWESKVIAYGNIKRLGAFDSEIDAARAYNESAKEMQGEFAYLNAV